MRVTLHAQQPVNTIKNTQYPKYSSRLMLKQMPMDKISFGKFSEISSVNAPSFEDKGYIRLKGLNVEREAKLHDADIDNLNIGLDLESTGTLNAKNVEVGSSAELNNANIKGKIKVSHELESTGMLNAKDVKAENAKLNNANIEGKIKVSHELESTDMINAKSIEAENAGLKNANIKGTIKISKKLKSTDTINAGSIETGSSAEINNANIKGTIKAYYGLKSTGTINARSIEAHSTTELNNANIKGTIKTYYDDLKSTGTLNAKNVEANDVSLKNANIQEKIKTYDDLESTGTFKVKNADIWGNCSLNDANIQEEIKTHHNHNLESTGLFKAKKAKAGGDVILNTVEAEQIISGRHVELGPVKKLESLTMLRSYSSEDNNRRLVFNNPEEMPKKKVNVLLEGLGNKILKLTIQTPDGDADKILKKLDFFEVLEDAGEKIIKAGKQFSKDEIASFVKKGIINVVKKTA